MKNRYRIQTKDRRFRYTGSEYGSWFSLEQARKIVKREQGERIVESDGVNILWEVF
jgi:hypothetical protein